MIDHLKISQQTAIEALATCDGTLDLQLIGFEPLSNLSLSLKSSIQTGDISEKNLFINVFGLDVNFFYIIEQIKDQKICCYERGIASIYRKDDKFLLNRKFAFINGNNSIECKVNSTGKPHHFHCCDLDHNIMIYSSIPPTYLECLSPPHSIITSQAFCSPQPVVLHNNSILARLDENIESIKFEDERLVDKISKIISKFTKQLKLKTSKLSLQRVEPEIIDMVPTSNIKAKRGSLYYDESDNKLKIYDGEQWKVIAFTEE